MKRLLGALVVAAGLVGGPAAAQRLVMGLAAAPTGLDPHAFVGVGDGTVSGNIYEALVGVAPDGTLVPALAGSWQSEGEHAWVFTLRPGVHFHDGSPFGAADVIASYQRVRNLPTRLTGLALKLRAVAGLEALDETHLRVTTQGPAPSLPFELSAIPILRRQAMEERTNAAFDSGVAAVGTGPFRFASYAPETSLELRRNDDWWGAAPRWQRVALRFIPRDTVRSAALLAGDVDVIERVAGKDAAVLAVRSELALARAPAQNSVYILANIGRAEAGGDIADANGEGLAANPLRDRRVRQALSLAINRAGLTERLLEGEATPAGQLTPPGAPGFDPAIGAPAQDMARARALLAEAGYPHGLRLVLHGPSDRIASAPEVVSAVAQMWSRVGLPTTVATLPYATYAAQVARGEFMLALYSCCARVSDPALVMNSLLATSDPTRLGGAENYGRYGNPALDTLLEQALGSFDAAARGSLMRAAIALVAEDVPVMPLYHPMNIWASRRPISYQPRLDGRSPAIGAQ